MNADAHPTPADRITNWDYEADVVIAGYGIAGAAAAVEATSAGADVLVLERTGGWGGAAAMAGGFIYLGGGTALQQACGFDDSADNMATFLNVAMGPGADENRIADYCAGSVAHFDWLVQCGVPFKPVFWGEPGWEPPADEGLMFTGGENAYPFNTIATPAPRGHVPQMANKRAGEASAGYMLMKPLVDTATSLGAQPIYDIHVRSLAVQSDGRVTGLTARRYGETVAVRARRGVVLACGSFAYKDAMVAQYAPRLVGRPAASIEQHDG
jgi:3-oxo-5alpha-steroid 4-dehydrogenase